MQRFRTQLAMTIAVLCAVCVSIPTAFGQTDTQDNTVTVNNVLTVTAPAAGSITHDGTDANQAFASADWTVEANAASGSAISFDVTAPFVHTTDATYKRDVLLDLSVGASDAGSGWATVVASDQTDTGNTDDAAAVTAASTAAGNATLALVVTMVNDDYSTMAAGDYATTVTATLTAN